MNTFSQKAFGRYIRKCRENKNMTRQELADKFNLTVDAIAKWEQGVRYPDFEMVGRLAGELGVSVQDIYDNSKKDEKLGGIFASLIIIAVIVGGCILGTTIRGSRGEGNVGTQHSEEETTTENEETTADATTEAEQPIALYNEKYTYNYDVLQCDAGAYLDFCLNAGVDNEKVMSLSYYGIDEKMHIMTFDASVLKETRTLQEYINLPVVWSEIDAKLPRQMFAYTPSIYISVDDEDGRLHIYQAAQGTCEHDDKEQYYYKERTYTNYVPKMMRYPLSTYGSYDIIYSLLDLGWTEDLLVPGYVYEDLRIHAFLEVEDGKVIRELRDNGEYLSECDGHFSSYPCKKNIDLSKGVDFVVKNDDELWKDFGKVIYSYRGDAILDAGDENKSWCYILALNDEGMLKLAIVEGDAIVNKTQAIYEIDINQPCPVMMK